MRLPVLSILLAAAAVAAPALAQTPPAAPAPDILHVSAAEAQALIAKAKAGLGDRAMAPPQALVRVPGYRALVEYRVRPTPASIHDNDVEFFYVLEGSGTLVLGGVLDGATRTNGANQSGTGVTGGETRTLAKGDFVLVPAGMAHYFATIGSEGLAVVTMKAPAAR